MLHVITLIFMEELSNEKFLPSAFSSHRHIKSDMLKSITREFLNFIFTIFSVLFERKFAKEQKRNYSEIRDYCYVKGVVRE